MLFTQGSGTENKFKSKEEICLLQFKGLEQGIATSLKRVRHKKSLFYFHKGEENQRSTGLEVDKGH